MAAPYSPPKKGEDWKATVMLRDGNDPRRFKVNPTLAAGDVKISKDGGAEANLTTLPSVEPASSAGVVTLLSATEMTMDYGYVLFKDQTDPPEWADLQIMIQTQL